MNTQTHREALLARKKHLDSRLLNIRQDLSSKLDADSAEQAIQLENREVLEEIARVTRGELESIDRQLADLEY